MNSFAILNTIIILGMIIAAASLLFIEELLPSIIAMSIMGSFLALEFLSNTYSNNLYSYLKEGKRQER